MLLTIYNTFKVSPFGHAYKAVKHITTKYDIIITDFFSFRDHLNILFSEFLFLNESENISVNKIEPFLFK